MKIGWLMDPARHMGGAEHTQAEFRLAAPDDVRIVDCPPARVDDTCDMYVIHNCVSYSLADIEVALARPTLKYWHDVGPWLQDGVRELLDSHAVAVCCSPIQAQYMGLTEAALIPPPVNLARFQQAARDNGRRQGACCIASWRNHGKGWPRAVEWAVQEGVELDFYGDGPMAPPGCKAVEYEDMPSVLARYETFVFLPIVVEPFGRLVAEAWASGCGLLVNELVGATWWLQHKPEAITEAAHDFWALAMLAAEAKDRKAS